MIRHIKTIISTIAFILLIPSITYAENCRTTKSGDFSDSSVWDCGHTPTSSDDISLSNDYSLNIDQNIAIVSIIFEPGSSLIANSYTISLSGNSLMVIPPDSSFNQGTSTLKMSDAAHSMDFSVTLYNLQWETPITAARTFSIWNTITKATGGTFDLDGNPGNLVTFVDGYAGQITPAIDVYYCASSNVAGINCHSGARNPVPTPTAVPLSPLSKLLLALLFMGGSLYMLKRRKEKA